MISPQPPHAHSQQPGSYRKLRNRRQTVTLFRGLSFFRSTPGRIIFFINSAAMYQHSDWGNLMKLNKKHTLVALITLIAAACGIAAYLHAGKQPPTHAQVDPARPVTRISARPAPAIKRRVTTDDIRREYGRLEMVTLRDGRQYRGAVITTSDVYEMVTVNGTVRFAMSEIQARDIVR
jgi:hypothetical protein